MAVHAKSAQGLACLGKQVRNKIWSNPLPLLSYCLRRGAHKSVYDKNPDDELARPGVVAEEISQPQPEKYWAPHPQTGIFGPATTGGQVSGDAAAAEKATQDSVLEEKAWFRPTSLEDLDKPHHS